MIPARQQLAMLEWTGWIPFEKRKAYMQGEEPPEFLHDLDAMHAEEQMLTKEQYDTFRDYLKEICLRDWLTGKHFTPFGDGASAAQRVEAFLKTIGKWIK